MRAPRWAQPAKSKTRYSGASSSTFRDLKMKNDRLSLAFACLCVPTGRSLRSLLSSASGSSQTHFAIQPLFLVYEFTEVSRERSTTHIALSQHRGCLSTEHKSTRGDHASVDPVGYPASNRPWALRTPAATATAIVAIIRS